MSTFFLLYFYNNVWRTARDSNPEPLVLETRTLPIELAIQIWWTDGESNPDPRLAKPLCSRYHYQPKFITGTT